jgi:hypothetical protein
MRWLAVEVRHSGRERDSLAPSAFDYLAGVICQNRSRTRRTARDARRDQPPTEEEPPSRLEFVRKRLEALCYDGRILLEELPLEVQAKSNQSPSSTKYTWARAYTWGAPAELRPRAPHVEAAPEWREIDAA